MQLTLPSSYILCTSNNLINRSILCQREGGADVPLFETIKTNAGTQPKNELQR